MTNRRKNEDSEAGDTGFASSMKEAEELMEELEPKKKKKRHVKTPSIPRTRKAELEMEPNAELESEDMADRQPEEEKTSDSTEPTNEEDNVPRDENGQPEYQGTMDLPEMTPEQKRAFDAVVFHGTQDDGEIVLPHSVLKGYKPDKKPKSLPQTDPKSDHLMIKSIKLGKNMKTGAWKITEVETNQGTFEMGSRQNERVNQHTVTNLALHLREAFEADLKAFLGNDNEGDK